MFFVVFPIFHSMILLFIILSHTLLVKFPSKFDLFWNLLWFNFFAGDHRSVHWWRLCGSLGLEWRGWWACSYSRGFASRRCRLGFLPRWERMGWGSAGGASVASPWRPPLSSPQRYKLYVILCGPGTSVLPIVSANFFDLIALIFLGYDFGFWCACGVDISELTKVISY